MQWHVKEFAKLTDITARTLHHYDKIGLLQPSIRQENGYRVYTEKDLLRLQQILALKFFGFGLPQIHQLLRKNQSLKDSFSLQVTLLQEKAKILTSAYTALQNILTMQHDIDEMKWEEIIESMKVYKNMEHVEQSWVTKFLDQQELLEYAALAQELEKRFGKNYGQIAGLQWQGVVDKVKQHLAENPLSSVGKDVAHDHVEFIHNIYGKKYVHLSRIIWEKGFKGNKIDDPYAMTSEMISWLDQAIDGYYGQKIQALLLSIQDTVTPETKAAWQDLMDEMSGSNPQVTQKAIINQALFINDQYAVDQQISPAAVKWLTSLKK
ncbi:MAG: MerR family transcriptional regulator [Candidatus Chromulinivorax sp.]|nr:MerR family transcriptional regulator [Candidatus Chromulinivorax sp.]